MTHPRDELHQSLAAQLDDLRSIGRGRQLRVTDGIDFSSNDYLGFAARVGLDAAPLVGSTGSRCLSGHSRAWEELESTLAEWHGGAGRHALSFPSGYVANEGLLSTLISRGDFVASDALNHGSIIDGLRLSGARRGVYPHQDLGELEALLQGASSAPRRFVVTESLFGMDGDRTDLAEVVRLCREYDALAIVDEAHATGCYGERGSGLVDELGLRDEVFATMHTCGKALGSHGAYVVADAVVCDFLVQSCRHFIFTTSLPDAVARATHRAVELCCTEPDARGRLRTTADRARAELKHGLADRIVGLEAANSHILAIRLGSDARAARWSKALAEHGYRVPAIRFPTVPEGGARLRISFRADHSEAEVGGLLTSLSQLDSLERAGGEAWR